jgi:PIN domain nuclease of toxin-antitoxin system
MVNQDLYIVDACALIAYLNGENGSEVVKNLLHDANEGKKMLMMHKVNMLETYYDHVRNPPAPQIDFFETIENLPIELVGDLSKLLFDKIIQLKSNFRISLADSFALATTMIKNATVITSDHHEMDMIEKSGLIKFLWIR